MYFQFFHITISPSIISSSIPASMSLIFFVVLTLIGWTFYGYALIGSAENDCGENPETAGWQTLMIWLLVLGTIPFVWIVYGVGAAIASCIPKNAEPSAYDTLEKLAEEKQPMMEGEMEAGMDELMMDGEMGM